MHVMGEGKKKDSSLSKRSKRKCICAGESHITFMQASKTGPEAYTSLEQSNNPSKRTRTQNLCIWVLQCSPRSYRVSQAATSSQCFRRSQWQLEIPRFLWEVQALIQVLSPARWSITAQNIVLPPKKYFVSWSSLVYI